MENKHDTKFQKHVSDGSVVLYGVPKVHYGAFGGCTPLPIAMKAAANYMGMELDYAEAIAFCGAAFRLTWNETCWDGGNVGDTFAFDDPTKVLRMALESLGCEYNCIGRDEATRKSDFIDFIKSKIDKGIPVMARGVIGPPEMGIIAGYRNKVDTLLGWNVFQEYQDVAKNVRFDDSGYYITSHWWENPDTNMLMAYGEVTGQRFSVKTIVQNAIEVMTPRRHGDYAKGGYAYDAWKKAILNESEFAENMITPLLVERLMCHGDATDCLMDGRYHAGAFFKKLAEKEPGQPLYGQLASQFDAVAKIVHKMFEAIGGWERGETQMKEFAKPEVRGQLGELIDECKVADEKALALLVKLEAAL